MIQLIKGFHDILPGDSEKWAYIVHQARTALERSGFREIVTPIMEVTELFQRGIGAVTDIVEKEMYTFTDRNGDSLSLRPEATAGILRAVVEHSMLRTESPLKLYTIGPMFRRERPSKGRFRQFFQVNAEMVGDDSPLCDAELISTAFSVIRDVGAQDLMIEINSVGCAECRPAYKDTLREYFRPHTQALCDDCKRRLETNPLRILDCKATECGVLAGKAPLITESLDASCREHFTEVQRLLELIGVPYRLEPKMVRGLDYYTRTAFELVSRDLGHSKAVGGGGRYDGLLQELGGPDQSGIGFAIGLDRLAMSLTDAQFTRNMDFYVAPLGVAAREVALQMVTELRNAGFSADTRFTGKSLKSQMKTADKIGAAKVIMLGENELAAGEVTVRDMKSKEQITLPIRGLAQRLEGDGI